jgi:DNA-binding NarL/FixJ family response regulator
MKKTILIYGLALAVLIVGLKVLEYTYIVRSLRLEVYLGIIALFFMVFGVWIGTKIMGKKKGDSEPIPVAPTGTIDEAKIEALGISPREYEVLVLIAKGHSNQEIANALFVSLSTIKTHSSNLFSKLDAKRRTQAIQKAKTLNIID